MTRTLFRFRMVVLPLILSVFCGARLAARRAPQVAEPAVQTTTEERVQAETWWPTKGTFPLNAYAGSAACAKCHADEAGGPRSAMRRTAVPAAESGLLASGLHTAVTLAPYTFALAGDTLTVTDGQDRSGPGSSAEEKIAWDLGAGDLAHTFLFQRDGRWVQSQVTWYTGPKELDTTTGFNTVGEGATIHSALGQRLTPVEARKCFGCHTVHSTSSAGFDPAKAEPGLGCEACHGPARAHAEAGTRAAVFNPASLAPADSIDFCGSCHRTTMDARLAAGPGSLGTAAVRFQPYRLEESKCWRATASEKLTCVACHDPHTPLERSAAKYDKTCVGCHTVVHAAPVSQHAAQAAHGAGQPGGGTSCVGCHMPRVEVSSMHGSFTDHWIRVSRPGEPFPE